MKWATLCVLAACATTPPEPEKKVAPADPPASRSSVAAVLDRGIELELTQEQREKIEIIDDALAKKNQAVKDEARAAQDAAAHPADDKGGAMGPSSGGHNPNMGAGSTGSGIGNRRGQAGFAPGRHHKDDPNSKEAVRGRLDDNDTAAFFEAEASLTEAQKPLAREIASKYREQLYNYRAWRDSQHDQKDTHDAL